MPTTVGKYPSGVDPVEQGKLLNAIDAIHSETGVIIPENMAIELLEAARSGKVTYETICEYMDKQVSKAVLGQTASTEGTPGKLGNEDAQSETRQDIVEADAGLLDECLNGSLVKWIVDYNFPNVTEYPRLKTRTEAEKDLKPLAERDKTLVKDIGLPVGRRYFYETYAIPEPEAGEEIVEPAVAGAMAGSQEFTEKAQDRFGQDDVDDLSTQGAIDSQEAISALLSPVLEMVEGAESFEEIGAKLYELYPEMESSEFQELLARAMFAAGLTGYAASETENNEQ
jgi:phage gp29-like protein